MIHDNVSIDDLRCDSIIRKEAASIPIIEQEEHLPQLLNESQKCVSDTDDCTICYENQITMRGGSTDTTYVFDKCQHRFCRECVMDHFKRYIVTNQIK